MVARGKTPGEYGPNFQPPGWADEPCVLPDAISFVTCTRG